MNNEQLQRKLAQLESLNDQLVTEVEYLDALMKTIGFSGGIATVKATANEIIRRGLNVEEII